jgi:hypothetical protein
VRGSFFNWEESNDEEQTDDESRDGLRTGPSCFWGTIPSKVEENKTWGAISLGKVKGLSVAFSHR